MSPQVTVTEPYNGPDRRQKPFGNSFWQINMGHTITLIVLAVGFVTTINKFDYRITTLENIAAANGIRLAANEEKMNAATGVAMTDTALGASNERRISAVEATVNKMAPDIAEIKTNVQWMIKARQ